MADFESLLRSRRSLLRGSVAFALAMYYTPGAFAEQLAATPRLTDGQHYPDKLPLDKDNDLIIINDSTTPAVGTITQLSGRILDAGGKPIKDAEVEIWQCDAKGVYLHTKDSVPNADKRDKNFQGYGQFLTASTGEYRFRTIRPVAYNGRTAPHIHLRVKKAGKELLTTQLFMAGFAGNRKDPVFAEVKDALDRELICADFKPNKEAKGIEYIAKFDVIVGRTPADKDHAH